VLPACTTGIAGETATETRFSFDVFRAIEPPPPHETDSDKARARAKIAIDSLFIKAERRE